MTRSLAGLIALFLLGALSSWAQSHQQQKKYFPKPFKDLYLGMPLADFANRRPKLPPETLIRDDIRYRWRESFSASSPIIAALYYFDDKGDRPLYEIVIFYRDLADRGKWVRKRLGTPNYKDREWRLSSAEGFLIRAWLYEEKLIFAGELPGTEWGPDESQE
ncbi:MAG: hypothetical protein AAF998_28050 [Bacteroidota bacterium]